MKLYLVLAYNRMNQVFGCEVIASDIDVAIVVFKLHYRKCKIILVQQVVA